MAETLHINISANKEEKYTSLLPQIEALISGESNLIANLANVMACLKSSFDFFWVGAYLVEEDHLILGPFQGSVACTRIQKGKGVCGTAWQMAETLIVPNVDEFQGHIACSSASRSEIVIPIFDSSHEVVMVIDVDSDCLNDFNETDMLYLEKLSEMITKYHF